MSKLRVLKNKVELQEILEKHQKWLRHEEGGERAVLRNTDLHGADLQKADLRYAELESAVLDGANLENADLRGANLEFVFLEGANLKYADLEEADLRYAILKNAILEHTTLKDADLRHTQLIGASLIGAQLYDANLEDANLTGVKFGSADLERANLILSILDKKEKVRQGVCLTRKIIGYKKCLVGSYEFCDEVVVKLEIPKGAIVFSINNSKCRTNIAKVLEISDGSKEAFSRWDSGFIYKVGKIVKVDNFNCQYNLECAEGIHFFKTKKEAEEY